MITQNHDSHTIKEPGKLFCWLCGITGNVRPQGWYGEWWLQIAHIASGGGKAIRIDDRRAVILACPRCHDCHVSNSDRFPSKTICGKEYPTVDERHFLWVKRDVDPESYDPGFLQSFWIGNLPEPERPPEFWCVEYLKATGVWR